MSKVSYIDLPPGFDTVYKQQLQPGDRFTFSRIRVKDLFLSRSKVKGISSRSQMQILAPAWRALSAAEQAAWTSAGAASGLTGWKQFLQDTTERRKAGISGYATPNTTYQSKVGRMQVAAPATQFSIEQLHPNSYYIYKKVIGTRSQYSPVQVQENITLPIEIAISYKTELTALAGDARARFYLIVYSSYQGQTLQTELAINFGMTDDWSRATATLSTVRGPVQGYTAIIEIYNAQGNLYFDNVAITHTGQNWARDPDCNNISQEFTKQYAQIPKHWAPVGVVDGVDYGSVYFNP